MYPKFVLLTESAGNVLFPALILRKPTIGDKKGRTKDNET